MDPVYTFIIYKTSTLLAKYSNINSKILCSGIVLFERCVYINITLPSYKTKSCNNKEHESE